MNDFKNFNDGLNLQCVASAITILSGIDYGLISTQNNSSSENVFAIDKKLPLSAAGNCFCLPSDYLDVRLETIKKFSAFDQITCDAETMKSLNIRYILSHIFLYVNLIGKDWICFDL